MSLPREIRDTIYRYLLSTTHTFVEDAPRPPLDSSWREQLHRDKDIPNQHYAFHPAILAVNKQIGAEAAEILYKENQLIVIEADSRMSWYFFETCLPQFTGVASYRVEPSLTVTLKGRPTPDESALNPIATTMITGPECLEAIIECLWQLDHFDLDLTLTVDARRSTRHRKLLEPFEQVQRMTSVSITGTNDQSLVEPLKKAMSSKPTPDSVKALIERLSSSSEETYRQKRYHLARIFWSRLETYERYLLEHILPRPDRYGTVDGEPLYDAYNATYAHRVRAGFKAALACLHLEDYATATKVAHYTQCQKNLSHRGTWTYRQSKLLEAKVRVCSAMARFGLKDRKGKWALIAAVNILKADGRHAEKVQSLLADHDSAKWEYPEEDWASPARAAEKGKKFLAYACRSYWDFLEPEEDDEAEEGLGADFEDEVEEPA